MCLRIARTRPWKKQTLQIIKEQSALGHIHKPRESCFDFLGIFIFHLITIEAKN